MRLLFVFVCLLWNLVPSFSQFPSGFAALSVAEQLDPTNMTLAPNGDIFVLEKGGHVLIIRNGEVLPLPFVELAVDNYNERGLSGVAVHPDYPNTPYVYLYYTVPDANHNRLIRLTAANDQALAGSMVTLLDFDPMPGSIHNGGAMLFGPDGKLYVAIGDGAAFGVAQSLNNLLGKVIRINEDGSIPADNPFYNQTTDKYRAIWALGLRNPYTFAIQPGTGQMAVGDVGSDQFEEVNIIEKGRNYGWPLLEGFIQGQTPPAGYKDPLHAYNHNVGCCVVGAAYYNPVQATFPANYNGRLFFGEYCMGKIWHIDPVNGGTPVEFATGLDRPLSLLTHPDGSLYCMTRGGLGGGSELDNTSSNEGTLWRIIYNPAGLPLVASQPNDVFVTVGETATFKVQAAGNAPFTYQWLRDGQEIASDTLHTLTLSNVALVDSGAVFQCQIKNDAGEILSGTALLRVTSNLRPSATIVLPVAGATYKAGDLISYSGTATDPETGPLAGAQFGWRIDFHHDQHTHPAAAYTPGSTQGTYQTPQVGETADNVWYRIHLFVTDPAGLGTHVWRDVLPQKSALNFESVPSGLSLLLDGQPATTPIIDSSVVGIIRSIEALQLITQNGNPFLFTGWSDGAVENFRNIETPAAGLNLTASYQALVNGSGTGLLGLYFDQDLGDFTTPLTAWRVDPVLDLYSNESLFPPLIGADYFSVRWTGQIEPFVTGSYRFYLTGDDGVRLWINDQQLIDSWIPSDSGVRESAPISLEGGEKYDIKVELFEITGAARIRLEWSLDNGSKFLVPQSQLYPNPIFSTTKSTRTLGQLKCQVAPNPFRDFVQLQVFSPKWGEIKIDLIDMAGRIILENASFIVNPGFNSFDLPTGQLATGLYLLRVHNATEYVVMKIEKL